MSTSRDWRPGFEQQTARINVSDDTWRAFRQLCLDDGEHVSVVLGRLVDHEVNRRRPPARHEPSPKPVNASTREHKQRKQAQPLPPDTSTSTAEVLSLFDQPDGDAPYT